ncbi:unnamed protein product [marine sediment metagenome]|uniref:Uncharacterized protein n=1 Tax=marine sediment metagenome TaxID=412755 RepID=X1DET6_9ZZZZ
MTSGDVDAIYGDIVYVSRQNTDKITRRWISGQYYRGAFARGWLAPHATFFCKKVLYEKYGDYNIKLEIAADYELMLRYIVKHEIRLGYLKEVLVKMRNGGKSGVIRGMIKAGRETFDSFRINKLPIPWRLLVYRPITIMKQVLAAKDCGISL